jgi:hypothetical protein
MKVDIAEGEFQCLWGWKYVEESQDVVATKVVEDLISV